MDRYTLLQPSRSIPALLGALAAVCLQACAPQRGAAPDLHALYDRPAQHIGASRTPVVVIPGILGSKLEEPGSHRPIWGSFIYGAADPDTPEGARLVALPMGEGRTLADLRDEVVPTEVLDTLTVDVGLIRGVEFGAYVDILRTLAAGKYRDQTLSRSSPVDYAGLHYTCYQFAYDWRRDISEQAVALHELITEAQHNAQAATGSPEPPRVDVVAHSMGGLVLRYYLRYGPHPLPADGTPPTLTWEGAANVENAILVGTPNAGSVLAMRDLARGVRYAALITPTYRPAVLGTMPAVYQLLPRPRHARVIDAQTGEPIDFLRAETWERYGWGLADPGQDAVLRQLLPGVEAAQDRRRIALDHLGKCLDRARQLFEALDAPASPPPGCTLTLIAGDARPTADQLAVDARGAISAVGEAPGDNTVTRASALMDERAGAEYLPRLRSPIAWDSVVFLSEDHVGLTRDPAFADFVLYTLLEKPRPEAPRAETALATPASAGRGSP